MKLIRFIVLLCTCSIFTSCSDEAENLPDNSPQIITIAAQQQRDTVFLDFQIPEKHILARRTGKLERLVENPEIRKNNLLVQFDDYDAFVTMSGEKEDLRESLTEAIDHFPDELKPVEKKWRDFAGKLSPDQTLPALPKIEYQEEYDQLQHIQLVRKYNALVQKEKEISHYFQLSPEDGFILKTHAKSEDYVKKNKILISYHPKKIKVTAKSSFTLSPKIQKQISANMMIRIPIGHQKIIQKTPTQITYLLTLNQKVDPKICPKYVIVNRDQNAFRIPKEYVGKNATVKVITEKGIKTETVSTRNKEYILSYPGLSVKIQKP